MAYNLKTTNQIPSKGNTVATNGKQYLVIHSTATPNATAANEATYFNREWANLQTFVQSFVDDKEVYQIYPNGNKAWGAGNINPYAYAQIEICEFDDANRAKAAIANAIQLAKAIVNEAKGKGISLQIVSHDEARKLFGGTDHTDPNAYFGRFGYTMDWFRSQVSSHPSAVVSTPKPAPAQPKPSGPNLVVDGSWGPATTRAVQTYLNKIGYQLAVDGSRGPATVRAIQQALNAKLKIKLAIDGSFGPATIRAMQRLLGTTQDGVISNPSQMVKALQQALNSGKQWI